MKAMGKTLTLTLTGFGIWDLGFRFFVKPWNRAIVKLFLSFRTHVRNLFYSLQGSAVTFQLFPARVFDNFSTNVKRFLVAPCGRFPRNDKERFFVPYSPSECALSLRMHILSFRTHILSFRTHVRNLFNTDLGFGIWDLVFSFHNTLFIIYPSFLILPLFPYLTKKPFSILRITFTEYITVTGHPSIQLFNYSTVQHKIRLHDLTIARFNRNSDSTIQRFNKHQQ